MNASILAFDYGLRNIGVAGCQLPTLLTTELPTLRARDGIPNWDHISNLLGERQVSLVLVGLPLNMDDSESELSTRARKFANRLHGRFGVKVELVDERLSTRSAKEEANTRGHKGNYGQSPVDSIAARLILESWLYQQHLL